MATKLDNNLCLIYDENCKNVCHAYCSNPNNSATYEATLNLITYLKRY